MSAIALASWLALSGAASAQTVHTVEADLAESLQYHYVKFGDSYEEEWVGTQDLDALQTIVMWHFDGPHEEYAEIRRSFLEFTLPDVQGTATLVLEKYYDSHGTDAEGRIVVAFYTPEPDLTVDDYDRAVTEMGFLETNPSVDEETVTFDVSPLLRRFAGKRLGIRLSVLDEGPPYEWGGFAGAAFRDSYNGAQPAIEIVVPDDGKTVVCHAVGRSGGMTLAVESSGFAAHIGHGDTVGACP